MLPQQHYQMSKNTNNKSNKYLGLSNLGINLKKKAEKLSFFSRFRLAVRAKQVVLLWAQNSFCPLKSNLPATTAAER